MVADVLYTKDSLVDVLLIADHFVMVTTIELDYNSTQDEIESEAWNRLSAEYGDDWVDATKSIINRISIDVAPRPTINDVMKSLAEEEPSDE
jgi:hypothetical protein